MNGDEIIKAIPKQVVEDVYTDGASGSVKELGEFGTDVVKAIRLISAPIQYAAFLQDRLRNCLESAKTRVPKERQIKPPNGLCVMLLESFTYAEEGSVLSEMCEELLSKAIDRSWIGKVHPAFAIIIKQLSPDDALLLFHLNKEKDRKGNHFINKDINDWINVMDHRHLLKIEQPKRLKKTNSKPLGADGTRNRLFPLNNLSLPEGISITLMHLKSLGLITKGRCPGQVTFHATEAAVKKSKTTTKRLTQFKLSEFGQAFAEVCLPNTLPKKLDNLTNKKNAAYG